MLSSSEDISEEVLPRPASKYDDDLIYVAIKVHKNYWHTNRTKQNNVMGIPPNRDQKRRQHWFAIPKERWANISCLLGSVVVHLLLSEVNGREVSLSPLFHVWLQIKSKQVVF